ncbi:MAG: Holliday junction resolvase RuvX [Thermoguttaceae bacterium]
MNGDAGDSGQRPVGSGQSAAGGGQWAVGSEKGNNGANESLPPGKRQPEIPTPESPIADPESRVPHSSSHGPHPNPLPKGEGTDASGPLVKGEGTVPAKGRVAGVDYGTVRIGIAISDPDRKIASPLENYTRRGDEQDARRFRRLVADEGVVLFVVGLPVHLDGRESEKSVEARRFGAWLAEATGVPVEFFDERFTSREAENLMLSADLSRKRRKRRMDMLAAQILLSGYLESQERSSHEHGIG